MTDPPLAMVSSCLLHKIKTGTDDKALSASNVYKKLRARKNLVER